MFQFYDSPIKSLDELAKKIKLASFNSMIVRLKASPGGVSGERETSFNSMIVRLKETQFILLGRNG